jgi:hypothetical protein
MADMSVRRQREIDEMMDLLASDDPAERREAAYWMGEAAVADAVPKLVDLYENDEDKSVRRAAGYALGMFRAVDESIKKGKDQKVVKLLKQVEEKGKLGRRANKGGSMRLILGLLISLIVLALAFQFVPNEIVHTAQTSLAQVGLFQVQPKTARIPLVLAIRQNYIAVRDDTTTLQGQFQAALGGGTLDCTAFFNNPAHFQLAPEDAVAYPDIAQIVERLNAAHGSFSTAYARFDSACLDVAPMPVEEVGPTYATLVSAIQTLPEIETALNAAERGEEVVLPTTQATAAPPTEILPTPTNPPPTTEILIADTRRHLAPLYAILEDVTSNRGAAGLLDQYWNDVRQGGSTDGCSLTPPSIPADYVLPEADAQASLDLATAVGQINSGLAMLRTGWTDFQLACTSDSQLVQQAPTEFSEAQQIEALFQAAEQSLDRVRDDI